MAYQLIQRLRKEQLKCIPMFLAALFIIAKTWKQPKCPSGDEWIKRVWCTNNSGILTRP